MENNSTLARLMAFCLLSLTGSLHAVTTNEVTLRISPGNSGDAAITYDSGSEATLTASNSNPCYVFDNWTVAGKSITNNPYTFTFAKTETVTANFGQVKYTISTSSSPGTWGLASGGGEKGCGSTVTLSATGKPGFGFTKWTSSLGQTGTKNPYTFTVSADESFVASFADVERPTVRITAPGPNLSIPTVAYIIEASASDNVGVAAVSNNLNGTGWQAMSYDAGYKLWYSFVTLTPSSANTIAAFSVDASGNFSTTNSFKFFCTAGGLAPLSIAEQEVQLTDGDHVGDTNFLSFDSAGYVSWCAFTNTESDVGTYTYTPTGPDTAELVFHRVLPTQDTNADGSVLELTFTDAYDATFPTASGGTGTIFFAATEESVPTTLDGFVIVQTNYYATHRFTNYFDSATFKTEGNNGAVSSGTYTFTPFTQVGALLVNTYTNPASMVGKTNYTVLMFNEGVSSPSGYYSSEALDASGVAGLDTGRFTTTTNTVSTRFNGPATLSGLQAAAVPTIEHSPAFTRSFGKGTFASISTTNTEPTDVGVILGNTRISTNIGTSTFLPLAPPSEAAQDDGTVRVTWKTSTSAISSNLLSGETANLSFIKSAINVPAALSGHTITVTEGGKSSAFKFNFNKVTGSGNAAGLSGTYTYAPYTPVMALVTITPGGALAGEDLYLLLYYTGFDAGACVSANPVANNPGNWTFKSGAFTMK